MDLTAQNYGHFWADDYDTLTPIPDDETARTVAVLAELADGGPVCELAVGTGRLAIPLARKGLAVTASDASPEMLLLLKEKDDGGLVRAVELAMPDVPDGSFALVFCVYNSFIGVLSQHDQLATVRNAAARLRPGGALVLEVPLLDPRAFVAAKPMVMTADHLMARFGSYDLLSQRLDQYYLVGRPGEPVSLRPDTCRLVPPAELDLMAQLAGLHLEHRWSTWDRSPVTGAGNTISVYRRTTS